MTTTSQVHARIMKKIINLDREQYNKCCWDDCDRDSTQLYRYRYHHHEVTRPCDLADRVALSHGDPGSHQWFAFCSERHLAYFINCQGWRSLHMAESQPHVYGQLPTGSKGLPL